MNCFKLSLVSVVSALALASCSGNLRSLSYPSTENCSSSQIVILTKNVYEFESAYRTDLRWMSIYADDFNDSKGPEKFLIYKGRSEKSKELYHESLQELWSCYFDEELVFDES